MFKANIWCLILMIHLKNQFGHLGCLPGEIWYERCEKCRCDNLGIKKCVSYKCNDFVLCPLNFNWFNDKKRCHCNNLLGYSICVDLKYQSGMNNQPCRGNGDYYFFDTCTFCMCNQNKTTCVNQFCAAHNAGVCIENESMIDLPCFNCTCSHTKFYVCKIINNCILKLEKPGNCLKTSKKDLKCFVGIDHECRNDYECSDEKKCCLVEKCNYRCRQPTF